MARRALLRASLLLALTLGSLAAGAPSHPARAVSLSVALPRHFAFGLQAGDADQTLQGWMPSSGAAWDYAWTYLPASATGSADGWKGWGGNDTFPLTYAQRADAHHYIPVFSFYEQATGGKANAERALNTPAYMAAYFNDFRTLMQRLGRGVYGGVAGFGKIAIVHVDPDLSGFVEQSLTSSNCDGSPYCNGHAVDPSQFRAAVAATGDKDVAAYPDTFQGFNWALLHLRDLYAPNVIMAANVSPWATGVNVSSDAAGATDRYALGMRAGTFAAKSGFGPNVPTGVSPYELTFEDPADHDAAVNNVWWYRDNSAYPNFHGWEDYLRGLHDATGAYDMPWQVPIGNQYYRSEDNTSGHKQDNKAEYIFGHIDELYRQAGVIGVLFGQGPGNSEYFDQRGDTVTNPTPLCLSYGVSGGQVCNDHTSTVSDDDGGYLRTMGQRYYAGGGYPFDNTPAIATPPAPVTPTATAITPAWPTRTPTAPATTAPTTAPATTAPTTAPATTAPTNTVSPPVGPTTTATPTATAPAVPTTTATPIPAVGVGPLSLSSTGIAAGGTLTGSVEIRNTSANSVTLRDIVIAARPPGGTNAGGPYNDLGGTNIVTLAPGAGLTVRKVRTFSSRDPRGTWYCFATYQTLDGVWYDDPTNINVTVQ